MRSNCHSAIPVIQRRKFSRSLWVRSSATSGRPSSSRSSHPTTLGAASPETTWLVVFPARSFGPLPSPVGLARSGVRHPPPKSAASPTKRQPRPKARNHPNLLWSLPPLFEQRVCLHASTAVPLALFFSLDWEHYTRTWSRPRQARSINRFGARLDPSETWGPPRCQLSPDPLQCQG